MESLSLSLVVPAGTPFGNHEPAPAPLLPVFDADVAGPLTPVVATALRLCSLTRLVHAVRRRPADLRSHVRRVLLAQETGNADSTCAALMDLCTALGDRGLDLQHTMVERAGGSLSGAQLAMIEEVLGRGPTEAEREATPGACLAPPAEPAPLVRRVAGDVAWTNDESDPFDGL